MAKRLELFFPADTKWINQMFGVNGKYYQKNGINIIGHNGIDFFAPDGANVRAAHDGVVIFSGADDRGGEGIEIVSIEAKIIHGVHAYAKTIYWHLQRGSRRVKVGDLVRVGTVIGLADNTGLSTGSHLHFGLKRVVPDMSGEGWRTIDRDNGYLGAVDPMPYMSQYLARDAVRAMSLLTQMRDALVVVAEKIKNLIK